MEQVDLLAPGQEEDTTREVLPKGGRSWDTGPPPSDELVLLGLCYLLSALLPNFDLR